jgi:hypothetical protein
MTDEGLRKTFHPKSDRASMKIAAGWTAQCRGKRLLREESVMINRLAPVDHRLEVTVTSVAVKAKASAKEGTGCSAAEATVS